MVARLHEVHDIKNPDDFFITWKEFKKQHGL